MLAVVTPGLDGGPAGSRGAAGRPGRPGSRPGLAERGAGPQASGRPAGGPGVLRGVSLSTDALAHDLATSPDLDAIVAGRPRARPAPDHRRLTPGAAGPHGLIASGRSRGMSATLGRAERGPTPRGARRSGCRPYRWAMARPPTSRWAMPWRPSMRNGSSWPPGPSPATRSGCGGSPRSSAPCPPGRPSPAGPRPIPVACPSASPSATSAMPAQTFLAIANDSPYPIRLACLLEAPGVRAGRGPRPRPPPGADRPSPAAATWSSTCSPSASRRSGSGRRGSASRR